MRTEGGALVAVLAGPATALRTERGILHPFAPAAVSVPAPPAYAVLRGEIVPGAAYAAIAADPTRATIDASAVLGRIEP